MKPQKEHHIELRRYADGMASVQRKRTVYTELAFYQKSDVLIQLTKVFCERFLPAYGDRTVDQMVQAARSVKQNIVEGMTDGMTSFETEIKLLGVARGSNQELLEDYKDYIKHHGIAEWAESDKQRYDKMRAFCREHSKDEQYRRYYWKWTDAEMCNTAICLCHMVDKALTTFIERRDREFVEEGGIRERMTAARLDQRGTQKQIIEEQAHEIDNLRAQIASLQREVELLRSQLKDNPGQTGNPGKSG